jgi:hypothetical protein
MRKLMILALMLIATTVTAADWNKPALTDTYSNFLSYLSGRINDGALWLDSGSTTPTNLPTGAKRWNVANSKFEKWSGTAWGDLASKYGINVDLHDGFHASQAPSANEIPVLSAVQVMNLPGAGYIDWPVSGGFVGIGPGGSSRLDLYAGSGNETRMSITQAGSVGIGTTTPATKLHVVEGSTDETHIVARLGTNNNGSNTRVRLQFVEDEDGAPTQLGYIDAIHGGDLALANATGAGIASAGNNIILFGANATTHDIWTGFNGGAIRILGDSATATRYVAMGQKDNSGNWSEYLRVNNGGNILIGTSTDNGTDKLQVNGTADVSGRLTWRSKPAFRGALAYGQSQAAGVSIVNFDSEDYDTDSIHSTTTNKSRLTVPTGVTRVKVGALVWRGATSNAQIAICKNGNCSSSAYNGWSAWNQNGTANIDYTTIWTPVISVTAGDYFEVSNYTASILSAPNAWFAMEIIE